MISKAFYSRRYTFLESFIQVYVLQLITRMTLQTFYRRFLPFYRPVCVSVYGCVLKSPAPRVPSPPPGEFKRNIEQQPPSRQKFNYPFKIPPN